MDKAKEHLNNTVSLKQSKLLVLHRWGCYTVLKWFFNPWSGTLTGIIVYYWHTTTWYTTIIHCNQSVLLYLFFWIQRGTVNCNMNTWYNIWKSNSPLREYNKNMLFVTAAYIIVCVLTNTKNTYVQAGQSITMIRSRVTCIIKDRTVELHFEQSSVLYRRSKFGANWYTTSIITVPFLCRYPYRVTNVRYYAEK